MERGHSNGFEQMKISPIIPLLILILSLGAFLRIHQMDKESIWTDEAVSLIEAEKDFPSLMPYLAKNEGFPFGYSLIMHSWIDLFGNSEFSIRFLSAIFGIASILLMYLVGKEIFDKKAGLISALLMSTAMLQIVYSQEARPFAIFGFLALLATYLFIKFLKNERNNLFLFSYIITIIISFYINYMALFLLIFHGAIFLFGYKNKIKKWLLSLLIIIPAILPMLGFFVGQVFYKYPFWVQILPKYGIPKFLASLGNFLFLFPLFLLGILVLIIFILFQKKRISFRKEDFKLFNKKRFILLLLFLGSIYLIVLDRIMISFTFVRISYFMVPIIYLVIAEGITLFENKKVQAGIIIIILLFNAYTLSIYYRETTKNPWKIIVDDITQDSESLIIFEKVGLTGKFFFDYYSDKEVKILSLRSEEKTIDEETLKVFLADKEEFWLISNNLGYKPFFDNNYKLESSEEYKKLIITKYKNEN